MIDPRVCMHRGVVSFNSLWSRVSCAPSGTRIFTRPGAKTNLTYAERCSPLFTRPLDQIRNLSVSSHPSAQLKEKRKDDAVDPQKDARVASLPAENTLHFSAANFFMCSGEQWLALVENVAKAVSKRKGSSVEERNAAAQSLPSPDVCGIHGWQLPFSFLLWRVRRHLLQLNTPSLVRGCVALQQLNLREGPSEAGVQTDVALEFLILLEKRLCCSPRSLSLGQAAAAAKALSEWRFAGEDPRAALLQQKLRANQTDGKVVDPIALRTQVFRRLIASSTAVLQEPRAQQSALYSAVQALSLLRACAKLQITELRRCYLLLLQEIKPAVTKTPSLLHLALVLHCCTRLLLLDSPVYRLALERLANADVFYKLLQDENQAKAAQVALGQLALCCVAFTPDQLTALDSQMYQNEHATGCSDGHLSLLTLHDKVLLNVFHSLASYLIIPEHFNSPDLRMSPTKSHWLGPPSSFLWKQLQIAVLAVCCERAVLREALSLPTATEAAKNPALLHLVSPCDKLAVDAELATLSGSAEAGSNIGSGSPLGSVARKNLALRRLLQSILANAQTVFPGSVNFDEAVHSSSARTSGKRRQGSELQQQVVETFKSHGLHVREEAALGPYDADVMLPQQALLRQPCIIEIDGPLHFVRAPHEQHMHADLVAYGEAAANAKRRKSLNSQSRRTHTCNSVGDSMPFPLKGSPEDTRILSDQGKSSTSNSPPEPGGLSHGLWAGSLSEQCLIYDVKSALKHRLLCGSGWRVLHISWNDWPQNPHNRVRAIAELLQQEYWHQSRSDTAEQRLQHQMKESSVFDDDDHALCETQMDESNGWHVSEPFEEDERSMKRGRAVSQSCERSLELGQSFRLENVFWGGVGNSLLHYKPQFGELLAAEVEI